ncbi:DNA-binding IclR family transcriptional regulator [Sphingobium sp. B1D3A]|uniref:DNA-binding IclR family transcriptional regulator n=2 Tax=Sphingobium lignivorans TaxID=2735886 RepID=A0ABR6NJT8_9SPHN|nr:IclR family transcriptional regulator C-terminal domain-containing protein [Sphingobium lignivorans]MBB5987544.1 DNA-binding IclR family transcriptional regulator [Sphingobium lignivorans]
MSTANRLLNVLALFTMDRPEWSVEEAATELDMTLSTTYRYFRSLVEAGLVAAHTPSRYTLGPAIIRFDRQMRLLDPLIVAARPVMRRLARELGPHIWVPLCRLYRTDVMCVHQETLEPPDLANDFERQPVSYGRGQLMPLHRGAPSKAILANMNFRLVRPIYDGDPAAMAAVGLGGNWTEVKRSLRALRSAGAVITSGELQGGMQGIAVPIFDQQVVIGSLSIIMQQSREMPPRETLVPRLTEGARQIEEIMTAAASR